MTTSTQHISTSDPEEARALDSEAVPMELRADGKRSAPRQKLNAAVDCSQPAALRVRPPLPHLTQIKSLATGISSANYPVRYDAFQTD